ncbi:MAG: acyloxyacyl hydrolase [Balneolaceae bacterium]
MNRFSLLLFFLFTTVFFQQPLLAQSDDGDKPSVEHNFRPGISFNYSPHSFKGWGTVQNSKMVFVNGQLWHTSVKPNNVSLRIGSELIFTHWVQYPENGIDGPRDQRVGFGLVPFHFVVPFSNHPITPFVSASFGLIFFNDRLPAIDGASLNYKLSSGLGVEIDVGTDHKVQLGYRLQHISNGNSTVENPGIDSHVFFANFIFAKW